MRKESFIFICVSAVIGFLIFFYIRNDFGIISEKDYTPTDAVIELVGKLKRGQDIDIVKKYCHELSTQIPAQKRYAYNHSAFQRGQYFEGTNFDQYDVYVVDENPDMLLGVFYQEGLLINWMIYPGRGHSLRGRQAKKFIELYRKKRKFSF